MSADPVQPPAPEPTPPKPASEAVGESVEALRLKRRFKRGSEAEESDKPDQAIEVLSSLLQDLVAKKGHGPAAPEPATPTSKGAKYHRLAKTGSGNPPSLADTIPAPTEATAVSPGDPALKAPASVSTPVAPTVTFRPAPVVDSEVERRRLRFWKTLFALSLLALAGLTGYVLWFPRAAAGPNDLAAKTDSTAAWTDATLQQLDRALAADQAGNLKEAQQLASSITPPDAPQPPGLAIYLASLSTRLDRQYDSEADLLRQAKSASPQTLAAVDAGLGFNFMRTRDFTKAAEAYEKAILNDPFSALLFYRQGEVARHLGHFPEAIASFRRALDRVPTGQPENASLRECIGLKLRLCQLESGQEGDFLTQMNEQLKAPSPSGYWLLTAAAVALQHKDMTGAAGQLDRARTALGTDQFDDLLNDYFFRAYADRKEALGDFFPDTSAHRAKLRPTMTHTIDP